MKFATGVFTGAALLAVAGQAVARDYKGSDTLEVFTKALVGACGTVGGGATYPSLAGATPEFAYLGGGSSAGGGAMRDGTQDIAPMSRSLNKAETCEATVEAGPEGEPAFNPTAPTTPTNGSRENWAVARDGITVVTSQPNALRCDSDGITHADNVANDEDTQINEDDFGASLAFNFTIPTTSTTLTNWKDVLRLLWAGALPADASTQTAANRIARCNSAARVALVNNWDNVIQHATACGAVPESCQNASTGAGLPLRHVYRRDDASGTTDTFLALLGLNSVGGTLSAGTLGSNQPFCNGTDSMDDDPIRVRCTTNNPEPDPALVPVLTANATALNDETCGVDQTTGLVVAVRVPTLVGTTDTNKLTSEKQDLYPEQNCGTGRFDVRRPPFDLNVNRLCPDGAPYLFTGCLTPLPPVGSADECRCVNAWTNRAPGTTDKNPNFGGLQNDGRVWNRILRGTIAGPGVPGRFGNPTNRCPVLRDERNVDQTLLDSRMRYRITTVNARALPSTRVCQEFDATRGIGCLSRAAECSVGFAGREALLNRGATTSPPQPAYDGGTALLVGPFNIANPAKGPSKTEIFASNATAQTGYPLARKLYFNSIVGVGSLFPASTPSFVTTDGSTVTPTGARAGTTVGLGREQAELMKCLLTESATIAPATSAAGGPLDVALRASGFLPLGPASVQPPIKDVDPTVALTCP